MTLDRLVLGIVAPFVILAGLVRDLRAALARRFGWRISVTEPPWEVNDSRSIQSVDAQERLATGFGDGGFVFGRQTYYRHHDSGVDVLFQSPERLRAALAEAAAGDRFRLYGSKRLPRDCILARRDVTEVATGSGEITPGLAAIRSQLERDDSEILYVLPDQDGDGRIESVCGPLDVDEWQELAEMWRSTSGALWILDPEALGEPLVDLWQPSVSGRVPTGGFTVAESR